MYTCSLEIPLREEDLSTKQIELVRKMKSRVFSSCSKMKVLVNVYFIFVLSNAGLVF